MRGLMSFDFQRSPYERPNLTWVCGRAEDGCPCRIGPDRRGRCRAEAECRPRNDRGRWVCCRPKDAGGPCAEGPRPNGRCAHPIPPCTPVRSLRARRGRVARWAAATTVGLLVLLFAASEIDRLAWLSPGPLSAGHQSVDDCASCHTDLDAGLTGWIHAALGGTPSPGDGDSRQCLTCHEPGDQPLQAHSLAPDALPEAPSPDADTTPGITPASLSLSGRLFGAPSAAAPDGAVACATCHGEHAGVDHDVLALGDQPCQACHVRKFAAFTDGHPAFESYPYDRRTRINFDHAGHVRKHFPDSEAEAVPKQCVTCHRPDARGQQMVTVGFEGGCATCHAGEVRGAGAAGSTGIAVLAVPGLDLETLRAHEAGIGTWPELSDRPLTAFLHTILAGDPALDDALATFTALDPLDLREAAPAQIDAVRRIAWAIKQLTHELVAEGPQVLQDRLARGLGTDVDPAQVRALAGGLPLAAVREAAQAWFPELATEIARHQAGQPVPMPASSFDAPEPGADTDESDAGETGSDDILGGDADGGQGDILGGDSDGGSQDDILGGDDSGGSDDILGGSSETGDSQADILGGGDTSGGDPSGGEDILGGDDSGSGGDILSGGETGGDAGGGDILGGDQDSGGGLFGGGESGGEQAESEPVEAAWPEPNPETWSALGGWYRDYFTLRYRPGDHADPFLTQWIGLSAQAAGVARDGPAGAVLDRLTASGAPGQCAKCHSLDAQADGSLVANWHGFTPKAHLQGFTRFEHTPHFARIGDDTGCVTCHKLAPDADYLAGFQDTDPTSFAANFTPIPQATCADCHVDGAAGDACTQCHNYHVGEVDPRPLATAMDAMESSGQ